MAAEFWKAFEGNLRTIPGLITTGPSADHSADQFKAMKITGNIQAELADTLGEVIDGVLQNNPTGLTSLSVACGGVSKCQAGTGGVAAGDLVMTDANGQAIAVTTGKWFFGRALTSAANAGEIFAVSLDVNGYAP